MREIFKENVANQINSSLFVYYGGHGCSGFGSNQNIVLNEGSEGAAYPLEARLRDLATMNGYTAVIAMFDCSRVPVTPGMTLGKMHDEEE